MVHDVGLRAHQSFLIIILCPRNLCTDTMNFDGKTSEQILRMLTDPCRYDRWKRPSIDGKPTEVSVRIYIYFIGNVEAQHLVKYLK